MPVELIHADAFDPQLGLVAHGPVDHVVADPAYGSKVHARLTTRMGGGGVRAERDLGFEALTHDVRRRAAEAFAAVVRRWVVVFGDLEGAVARWARVGWRRLARTRPQLDLLEPPALRARQLALEDV